VIAAGQTVQRIRDRPRPALDDRTQKDPGVV
jgi:hypothetical protein